MDQEEHWKLVRRNKRKREIITGKNKMDQEEHWKLVRINKRKREIITGKNKTDSGGLRGIVKTLDIYDGRCAIILSIVL